MTITDTPAICGSLGFLGCLLATGAAHADGLDPVKGAFGETKYIFDTRLRVEDVDQDPLAGRRQRAHVATARSDSKPARRGTPRCSSRARRSYRCRTTTARIRLCRQYAIYPVVADPEAYEINRFQLTNTSLPGTTLTLGRQRIVLDDQRFVGAVGWRQNEQTFDALRMVNRSVANLVLDATYLNRVNRVFGDGFAAGRLQGRQLSAERSLSDQDRQDHRVWLSARLRDHHEHSGG